VIITRSLTVCRRTSIERHASVRVDAFLVPFAIAIRAALVSVAAIGLAACPGEPHDAPREVSNVQAFDSSALRSALERIVQWHARHHTNTAAVLRPGLSEVELQRQLDKLPCRLPHEIQALYAWHDGTEVTDDEFIWYHYFPSLESAINSYRRLTSTGFLPPGEFPVLEFEGEYYVVRCSNRVVDASPVWHVHHNPERNVNYVSFTAYMETAAEWYETGAAEAHDLRRLREIHQRHNPGAVFPYAVN